MSNNFLLKIECYLGRPINLLSGEVALQDDGDGAYISEWNVSEKAQPTQEQLDSFEAEAQSKFDLKVVQNNRQNEYPSIADQLDKIYHEGIDAWKTEIKVIKDKYPKPEAE